MANPQTEKGYTRIANEIMEALAQTKINSDAWKLLVVILRKTYGFQKKQDRISLSQFVLATQLKKSVVCRGLNKLQSMNIIIRIANDNCTIYQFNKDFDTWKPLAKLLTLAKQQTTVSRTANASLAKQGHTKETTTKETLTKEISEQGSQVNSLIKLFSNVNPSYEKFYSNKTQRSALQRLMDKYTDKKVVGFIKYLPIINEDKYARGKSITPLQLEDNLAHIVNHFRSNNKKITSV